MALNTIKNFAVDIDGVLLHDTFSPVLRKMLLDRSISYTSEIERNLLSQPREQAAAYVINVLHAPYTSTEHVIKDYFDRRELYLRAHPEIIAPGILSFLDSLLELDVCLICYGGLPRSHFDRHLSGFAPYFSDYVCTNDFRPGIKEIMNDVCKCRPCEICFIDDVNSVAETAKLLDVPFIGVPSQQSWSFQKAGMFKAGVKYIVDSISDINKELIYRVDDDAASGSVWR